MRQVKYLLGLLIVMAFGSCGVSDENNNVGPNNLGGNANSNDWLVPINEVFDGGPGKDGIPALENSELTTPEVAEATYLDPLDLVIGYKSGDEVRAYPHKILDWHEIANDKINGENVAITYCPLTGTAIGWNRELSSGLTTFGVSGFLFNTNLIPFDRKTDSNWSQMLLKSVNGTLIGSEIETFQVVETTWFNWKTMYPDTKVLSTNTGFQRNYNRFPYGDYKTNNNNILFPFSPQDPRLPNKDRVHGIIINGKAKVYPIKSFNNDVTIIEDSFEGRDLVIVGSITRNFANSFESVLHDGTKLSFTALQDAKSVVMEDSEGNQWDIFGIAVNGPRQGQRLNPTQSFIGYWFSWGAFYPNPEIYNQG